MVNKMQKWLATEHIAESRVQRLPCCFLKKLMQMKTLYLFVKQVALPSFGIFFFLMNGLWQLNTDTVFKYSEQTKCTMQKHHPSTVSITIFVDFNGVTLYTPFCRANLKCSSRTIHHLALKWLKLWLHTLNRKTR